MHVGILGGGQLGRMLAEAGHPRNLEFSFLDPKKDACAGSRGKLLTGQWTDRDALARMATCDRVTFDFENVPKQALDQLAGKTVVRPGPDILAIAQDRMEEKQLFRELDIPVAPFAAVNSRPDLLSALEITGFPAVLKTRRMGYDGKGQEILRDKEDLESAWQTLGSSPLILEQFVPFDSECAMAAVRDARGDIRFYPLTRTLHDSGILCLSLAPEPEAAHLEEQARGHLAGIMERFKYVGLLTMEFFLVKGRLLANEIAPRVHNSAHWTIEGAECSQFDNHLRAVCDQPLGSTRARGLSVMVNWIGEMPEPDAYLAIEGLFWHDYGKQPREGRKVGHATLIAPDAEGLETRLSALQRILPEGLAGKLPRLMGSSSR